MTASPSPGVQRLAVLAMALSFACATAALAQVVVVPPSPQIGSSNPITAEPTVTRPHSKPCVVQLFQNLAFADFNLKSFNYAPPSACPGPWAKVVFTADFTVTAGRQFDRTAAFYLGHANIYYGTTAEPRKILSPSWHVERDVTDLTAIFTSPQTGEANIGNVVNSTYTGIIYANAELEFYPANGDDAPRTPDIVVPVNGTGGDAGTLNTTSSQITQTLDLPTNVERVFLDVIAQSQSNDEFWYLCVTSDQASNLESCGNTAFRETEITIDGQPAGVAPVYLWIYTGGIDPYLWEPIPGVQTLDFKPYRVDLTPFAGLLSDGNSHTVGVSVYNANSYFLATANLLAYQDHGKKKLTGGVLRNTLSAAPTPVVTESISAGPTFTGSIDVASKREFEISGYVETSHGRIETTIEQSVNFLSTQQFNVTSPNIEIQNAQQTSTLDSRTTTRDGHASRTVEKHFSYPLTIDYSFIVNPDNSFYQAVTSDQKDLESESQSVNNHEIYESKLHNEVSATDTLKWDTNGVLIGPFGAATTENYHFSDSRGHCYGRTLTAADQKLTSVADGRGCGSDH